MNKNTTDITLSSYFNDIVIGYYEDEDLVKQFGRQLGYESDCLGQREDGCSGRSSDRVKRNKPRPQKACKIRLSGVFFV